MSNSTEKKKGTSRRKFLIRGGLGTLGVLAVGTYVMRNPLRRMALEMAETMVPPYSGTGTEPNLWFEMTSANQVILHSPKVEMGQGTFTSLTQMVADEMDVAMDQIQVVAAATGTGIVDGMSTGGSLSVASLWTPLREMAATMREMLRGQAASKLGVSASSLSAKNGVFSGGGKTMTYAEAADGVTEWKVPDAPPLKSITQYKYIGKPIARTDLEPKVFGEPIFGLDAEMPDMLHAAVVRPSTVGAKFVSADTSAAESMPGVVKVIQKDDWVGVVANSYPEALAAKRKIKVKWDIPKKWTEELIREMLQVGKGNKMITQKEGSQLDPNAEGVLSLEYTSPIGAHAQIEPNGAVAEVKDGTITVILSTQVPGATQKNVAKAFDTDAGNVNIIPTYLGGGFGRRLNTNHAIQTAQMAEAVGRPVKYIFTRKEEFQHDTFRPPTHHIVRGKLDADGEIESLEHHYASGDVAFNSLIIPNAMLNVLGTDVGAMRGGNVMYGKIKNRRVVQWHTELPFATSFWRSLGLLANTFAIESTIDEMALQAGKDPIQMRLNKLGNDESQQRIRKVIETAVEKGNYQDKPSDGRAMGFAASIDGGAPCAMVVEVSVEDGEILVHRATVAFDCGLAVNPDQVKAQCEGCVIMGISGAVHERMTLRDGQLYPTIYGPYDMALMKNAPKEIDVHIIAETGQPLPVGEPPLGPIGAAIGNAVRRLTGKRLTDIPMKLT